MLHCGGMHKVKLAFFFSYVQPSHCRSHNTVFSSTSLRPRRVFKQHHIVDWKNRAYSRIDEHKLHAAQLPLPLCALKPIAGAMGSSLLAAS